MPWHVSSDHEECSGYAVVKDSDGSVAGCHDTKAKAEAQLKALYANEPEENSMSVTENSNTEVAADVDAPEVGAAADTAITREDEERKDDALTEEVVKSTDSGEASKSDAAANGTLREEEAEEEDGERAFKPFKKKGEDDEEEDPDEDEDEDEEDPKKKGKGKFKPFQKKSSDEVTAEERICNVPIASREVTGKAKKDHRNLPTEVIDRLKENNSDVGVVDSAGRGLFELRFRPEFRTNDDGTASVHGYATVYGHRYDVAGGPPYGFTETIKRDAAKRSVEQRDDVRLLVNHDGIALARTRSGTLRLESDDTGLYIEATLDVQRSPLAQSLFSAMDRKDMDEMSFAFKVLDDEWDDEYSDRSISEVMLYDVSIVTYPANPAALASLKKERSADSEEVVVEETEEREETVHSIDLFTASALLLELDEQLEK